MSEYEAISTTSFSSDEEEDFEPMGSRSHLGSTLTPVQSGTARSYGLDPLLEDTVPLPRYRPDRL